MGIANLDKLEKPDDHMEAHLADKMKEATMESLSINSSDKK